MATTFIPIDTTKRLGSEVRQTISLGTSYKDWLERIKTTMETMIDGSDYTVVETEFGIPTGQGQTFYNLIAGAYAQVNEFNTIALLTRLG